MTFLSVTKWALPSGATITKFHYQENVPKAVNYFRKKLHHRCFTKSKIYICLECDSLFGSCILQWLSFKKNKLIAVILYSERVVISSSPIFFWLPKISLLLLWYKKSVKSSRGFQKYFLAIVLMFL